MTVCSQALIVVLSFTFRPAHPDVVARFDARTCAGPYGPVDFRLYVPPSSRAPNPRSPKKLPLVVWFHGGGESGTDNRDQLAWLELVFGTGSSQHDSEAFVVAMQFPADTTSAQPAPTFDEFASLDAVLDDVTGRHTIDGDRIYLAGISLGANRAWQYACRHPGRFAGLLSMAAGPISKEEACKIGDLPIWAFQSIHEGPARAGELQEIVGRENSQNTSATVTVVNSGAHDCWTPALTKFHAWRWLLDQRRGERVRRFGQSFAGQYLSRSQALGTCAVLGIGSVWLAATAIGRLARSRGYRCRCEFQRARDDAG